MEVGNREKLEVGTPVSGNHKSKEAGDDEGRH